MVVVDDLTSADLLSVDQARGFYRYRHGRHRGLCSICGAVSVGFHCVWGIDVEKAEVMRRVYCCNTCFYRWVQVANLVFTELPDPPLSAFYQPTHQQQQPRG